MKKLLCIILIVVFLSACQTTTQVNIRTNVPGAQVTVDGKYLGDTPVTDVTIKNSPGKTYQAVIEKEGYETLYRSLQTETKTGNAIAAYVGYALCWLILPAFLLINGLWIEGPVPDQYFILTESGT